MLLETLAIIIAGLEGSTRHGCAITLRFKEGCIAGSNTRYEEGAEKIGIAIWWNGGMLVVWVMAAWKVGLGSGQGEGVRGGEGGGWW